MRVKATIKKILAIIILVVFCIIYLAYRSHFAITRAAASIDPVHVSSYLVKKATFSETTQTNAQIKAVNTVALHPKVSGYVTHIYTHEGQLVKKGQLLIALDHATDQDDLAQKKANADLANANYNRALSIKNTGAISKQQLEKLHATYLSNKAAYQQSYDTLKDKLIISPLNGVIGSLNLTAGDYVTPAKTLTSITDLDHLKASYSLGAHFYHDTHLKEPITVASMVNPNLSVTATISYVSATVHANTQTFNVHAQFQNTNQVFSPGETATITQTIAINPNGITVPLEAVMTSLEGNNVYVIKNHHAVKQPVTLGLAKRNKVQILKGLQAGDRIILSTIQVHDGSKVSWQ
jgi:membrane fusion protein (multidrug efflux system)